jgi:hypothetical protein
MTLPPPPYELQQRATDCAYVFSIKEDISNVS